jgi:alkylated DNA nucleotide flippase Atl1
VDDEYVEAVLLLVERIPPGRAMAYGAVADVVGEHLGRGGPRTVGAVMSA